MVNHGTYQGVPLCKREKEWIEWYQKGSDYWWNAFYMYKHRKKYPADTLRPKSWFNKTLKGLKDKGLFSEVPFVLKNAEMLWAHPGFQNDGYKAEVVERDASILLNHNRPIL